MAGYKDIKPRWKKGESGNPNGRPRKFVSALVKETGYKLSEVQSCIQAMLAMTVDELKDVYESKDATILEKTIAGALKESLKKGNLDAAETLISRVFGKSVEKVDSKMRIRKIKIDVIKSEEQTPPISESEKDVNV